MTTNLSCPKCNSEINPTDIVCIKCGLRLLKDNKNNIKFSKEKAIVKPSIKKSTNLFGGLISIMFFIVSVIIIYFYIFDFDKFFKLTDFLASQKQTVLSRKILNFYKTVGLYKYHNLIDSKLLQLELKPAPGNNKHKTQDIRHKT